MAATNLKVFLRRLTRGMGAVTLSDLPDQQLIDQFLASGDESAFEALVRRHGPMVYRVCWRVLQHPQDVEDAFQATFLVLAQKLRTVRKHTSLASWVHGVAHRVALKAKAQAATRRRYEQQATSHVAVHVDEANWGELRAILDAELTSLPEKWRLPLILCYLQGQTQDEAARELGWSKNTLRRRLGEARSALGRRLGQRGVTWSAACSAVLYSDCVVPTALPPRLVGHTVEAAARVAAGQGVSAAIASANAVALMKGVLIAMKLTTLKIAFIRFSILSALSVLVVCQSYFSLKGSEIAPQLDPAGQTGKVGKKAASATPARGDLAKLQGVWTGHLVEIGGRALPEQKPFTEQFKVRVRIKAREITLRGPTFATMVAFGSPVDTTFTFKIDESRSPKHIDLTAPRAEDDIHQLMALGLYELDRDGNGLVLCLNTLNKKRPKESRTAAGTSQVLIHLKRDPKATWEALPRAVGQPQP
jgi:RNA polymerase sigma-70 factor (ECF subfamily)